MRKEKTKMQLMLNKFNLHFHINRTLTIKILLQKLIELVVIWYKQVEYSPNKHVL